RQGFDTGWIQHVAVEPACAQLQLLLVFGEVDQHFGCDDCVIRMVDECGGAYERRKHHVKVGIFDDASCERVLDDAVVCADVTQLRAEFVHRVGVDSDTACHDD